MTLSRFKIKLANHLMSIALSDNEQPEHERTFQSIKQIQKLNILDIKCSFPA